MPLPLDLIVEPLHWPVQMNTLIDNGRVASCEPLAVRLMRAPHTCFGALLFESISKSNHREHCFDPPKHVLDFT
jgi:hypothetical protein